jgi:hypothetical protein
MPDDDPGKAHTIQLMIGRSIPNTNSLMNPMAPQMAAIYADGKLRNVL